MRSCIICKSDKNKAVFSEFGIDILKCLDCGHIFSSYDFKDNYDGYFGYGNINPEEKYWWDEAHYEMYDDFCRKFIINKKGRLLDAGCGLGYFVKKLSQHPSWEVCGYEISKNAVGYAKKHLNLNNVFVGRIEESDLPQKYFNIITLWDVIEHIPHPDLLLSRLFFFLADDGFLFIHTPNAGVQLFKARLKKFLKGMDNNTHYLEVKDHVNIYSPSKLRQVLSRNGFKNIEFIHLKPIQSVSGSRNRLLKYLKNFWFYISLLLYKLSWGRINTDNLFVVAKK